MLNAGSYCLMTVSLLMIFARSWFIPNSKNCFLGGFGSGSIKWQSLAQWRMCGSMVVETQRFTYFRGSMLTSPKRGWLFGWTTKDRVLTYGHILEVKAHACVLTIQVLWFLLAGSHSSELIWPRPAEGGRSLGQVKKKILFEIHLQSSLSKIERRW